VRGLPVALAVFAAIANLAGAAAIVWRSGWSVQALDGMVAIAAGFMVAVSLTELFPRALEVGGANAALVALAGYVLVHFSQHVVATHFHFGEETHQVSPRVGVSALLGLLLHTLVDGVAIASAFQVSESLGTLVALAILLHKLPEGFAISSLFLAAGMPRRSALAAAGLLGLATIVGVVLTDVFTPLGRIGLPLSAGVTLYVGASNLVPELQHRRGWRLTLGFIAGCALFLVVRAMADV
jgi:zinc and cadmium transporter